MGGYNMKRYFLTLLQKIRGYFTRFDIDPRTYKNKMEVID
jgi:hypothetical protein